MSKYNGFEPTFFRAISVGARGVACLLLSQAAAPAAFAQPSSDAKRVVTAVEKALQRHAGDVHACFGRALADRLDVSGKLELEVTVGAAGKVQQAEIASRAATVPEGLATCVVAAAKGWRVDDIEQGASVVLPLMFSGQSNQYVVKADDAPARGPQVRGKASAPFKVKILVDPMNVKSRQLAVSHLTVSPANRVAMHRHSESGKVLYILKGAMRLLGPSGQAPVKLGEGDAVFIPKGYPHVIENMGRQIPVEMLQVFTPPGPELVYRDPADAAGRAAFEVLRAPPSKPPEGAKLVVGLANDHKVEKVAFAGGKAQSAILLAPEIAGMPSLAIVTYQPGATTPPQTHDVAESFSWVVSGGGVLKVGQENHPFAADQALFVPPGQPSSMAFTKQEATQLVQVFAPAGPEQQFKAALPAPSAAPRPITPAGSIDKPGTKP